MTELYAEGRGGSGGGSGGRRPGRLARAGAAIRRGINRILRR